MVVDRLDERGSNYIINVNYKNQYIQLKAEDLAHSLGTESYQVLNKYKEKKRKLKLPRELSLLHGNTVLPIQLVSQNSFSIPIL